MNKRIMLMALVVAFLPLASAQVIESIVIGNDKPVQVFSEFDSVAITARVEGTGEISASYCFCNVENNGCSRENVYSGQCGPLAKRAEARGKQFFVSPAPRLEPGTYKLWVEATVVPRQPVGGFWYPSAERSTTRGVIKIKQGKGVELTSLKPLVSIPLHSSVPRSPALWSLSEELLQNKCVEVREDIVNYGDGSGSVTQLSMLFNPRCQLCGDFELKAAQATNPQDLNNPVSYKVSIPCQADLLVVGRGGQLPPHNSEAFNNYLSRVIGRGISVKVAEIGTFREMRLPQTGPGKYYLAEKAERGEKNPGDSLTPLTSETASKAVKRLRSKVRPKYVLLLGPSDHVPFHKYERRTANTGGFPEEHFFSDRIYMTDSENPRGNAGVIASRVPLTGDDLDAFFETAADVNRVGAPLVLTTRDEKQPSIEEKARFTVLPRYYDSTQCTEQNNCFYAPETCDVSTEGEPRCSTDKFRRFLAQGLRRQNGHFIAQLHGGDDVFYGPAKQGESGFGYPIVVYSNSFSGDLLRGTLFNFQSCSALNPEGGESLGISAVRDGGAVAVFGPTGKTSKVLLLGRKGRSETIGASALAAIKQCGSSEVCLKYALYGDPTLGIRIVG